jgi:SAM-dependent methyltransferase
MLTGLSWKEETVMTRVVSTFLRINKELCRRIEPYLPQAKANIWTMYVEVVARHMNARPNLTVVDVGGGRFCPFAKYRQPSQNTRIIAVDTSEDELRHNTDVDERRSADIVHELPFETGEVDLIVSRSVLEHLESIDDFVGDSRRTLRKGGSFIHLFPSKFAPFALLNQALPHALSKRLVDFFRPEKKGICGFPAIYNNCYYSAITKLLEKHEFEVIDIRPSYYQSLYFDFCAPLFLLSALYEALIQTLGARNLCAYLLVIARKK